MVVKAVFQPIRLDSMSKFKDQQDVSTKCYSTLLGRNRRVLGSNYTWANSSRNYTCIWINLHIEKTIL